MSKRSLEAVLINPGGTACSHQEPTKIKSMFLCKNFLKCLKQLLKHLGYLVV